MNLERLGGHAPEQLRLSSTFCDFDEYLDNFM